MNRRLIVTVGALGAMVLGMVVLAGVSNAENGTAPGAFKPVAKVSSLMHGQGMLFKRIKKAIAVAETPHRLGVIKNYSQVLAELSNVNQYNETKADYQAWARELRDEALALSAEAGKAENASNAKLKKLFRALKSTCGDCHDVYQDEEDEDHDH